MRKKMLYIMGIDWNWIYQRPQILAQMLSKDYDLTVVFPRSILKWKGKNHVPQDVFQRRILYTIPYQEKNVLLGTVAKMFQKKHFEDYQSFDFIFIGYPLYARYIPLDYKGSIIYDCMDDFEKLYPDHKRVYRVTEQEKKLIKRCKLLLASSEILKNKADKIARVDKAILVRNGVNPKNLFPIKPSCLRQQYRIGYIGTISAWFDYHILQASIEAEIPVQYHLIGPVDSFKAERSEKIIFEGTVEHSELGDMIKEYDCLIMPFEINELVKTVDPVKLYEYIAFGKCIISVYYKEIARFEPFVYFYTGEKDFLELLIKLCNKGFPPKYNSQQQKQFLQENSWEKRYNVIQQSIRSLDYEKRYNGREF